VIELDDGHSDGGDQKMKVFHIWKRRKRKIKLDGNQDKCIARVLVLVIKTP
jgi:hypothetical protein